MRADGGRVAKLVDALDLGSSGATHQSSSLCVPTKSKRERGASRRRYRSDLRSL